MWTPLFTILYISAAVLASTATQIVEIPGNVTPNALMTETPETPKPLTCPKGFDRVGMYCYHVSRKKTDRLGAIQICKRKKSDLAKPLTQDIDRLLRRYIAESRFRSVERWIDITYNPEKARWVLGTTTEKIPYHGFVQKQSEMELNQHCAAMAPKKSYAWVAQICHTLNNYVCQTPKATAVSSKSRPCPKNFEDVEGICYYFSEDKETWQEADKSCQKMNSTLAQSITQDIDRQLRSYLASPRFDELERWIDVRYNTKTKKWVLGETNEEIPYDGFWKQESTKNPDKHCAIMQPKESYAWEPTICHNLKYAVCEIALESVSTKPIEPDSLPLNLILRSPECPKGFRRGGTNCYHVSKKKASWLDAIMVCRGKNSSLANPSTEDLNEQLRNQTAGFKQVERWIDVTYNETSQEWVVGTTGKKITYNGFREKPSHKDETYCAVVDPSKDYAWTPRMCFRRRHYVCQIPLVNVSTNSIESDSQPLNLSLSPSACPKGFGHGGTNCYHVSKKKASWLDAIMVCRGKNSSLANPSTEDLNEQLRNQTAGFKQVEHWIDVTYNEISQEWVVGRTGQKITYDRFREKPSDRNEMLCAVMDPRKDFAWTPRGCYRLRHYVCQMPLGKSREQSPEKLNSTLETIKQDTESHTLKTNEALNDNKIPEFSSVTRRKKESSLSPKSAPETESSIKNVVKSQDSNVPDQPIENLPNSFTENYRTESRVLNGEPSSMLIEPTRLTTAVSLGVVQSTLQVCHKYYYRAARGMLPQALSRSKKIPPTVNKGKSHRDTDTPKRQ